MNREERLATLHTQLQARIDQVVRFDRYYARRLRATADGRRPNESNVTVAQADIFHELMGGPRAVGWLRDRLQLDAAYLSRNLRWCELTGSIRISVAPGDRRERLASLTGRGERTARILEGKRANQARQLLGDLPRRQQRRLVRAMSVIVEIFERDTLTNLIESLRER